MSIAISKQISRLLCFVVFNFFLQGSGFAEPAKQTLKINDMQRIADLSTPVVSPDGRWIAYAVSKPNPGSNKTMTKIWLSSWDGKKSRVLNTPDNVSAWQPQFSGDGATLVFLSDQSADHVTQVWAQKLDDDAAHQISKFDGGVMDFSLAPDGRHLAAVAEISNGENDQGPIVIDRYQFKDDERGYLTGKRRRLFQVNIDDQSVTPLTAADADVWMPSWSPDGKHIAYVAKREHESDRHTGYNVYLIDAQNGITPRCLSHDGRINNDPDHLSRLAWSPDSQQIAFLQGGAEHLLEYAPWELAVANVATGEIRQVGKKDRNFTHPNFSSDGKSLYAIVEESRTAFVTRIDLRSGASQNLTQGQRMDFDFSIDNQNRIALLSCGDLYPCRMSALDGTTESLLPDQNAWLNDYALAPAEDVQMKSKDGTLVHAMLIKPLGYQPNHRYPTIVRVHGGPVYQFSHEFMFDWQIFAANGYAVLAVNPRGSSGRGFDYARAIWADWGNKDVQDVLAATDYAEKIGVADKNRLGIGGWSYGGMLTDYTIATDQRFKAAIAGAGAANILSNYGSDEYIVWLENELGTPWKNLDAYLKVSFPFFHNDRIVTPTLFLCSALDFNVPCAGSEQMYQALNSRRIPTQLVIYRDQHHELDVPANLTDRLTRYLNWYNRFLKDQPLH